MVIAAVVAASRTSLFHARHLEVSGTSSLSRADVLEIAGLDRRTNVAWLDEDAAERRLEANAWVADAEISVSIPFTVEISVTEREPVAVAWDGRRRVLLAGDGTSLGSPGPERGLPLIELPPSGVSEGTAASPQGAARALGAMAPDLRSRVARVRVLLDGTLEVWLRSGPRVSFGAPDAVGLKARAIARALAWAEREGEQITALSVVSPASLAATLAP